MLTTWSEDDDAEGLSAGSDFEAGSRKAVLVDEDSGSSGCEDDLDACWSSSAVKKLMLESAAGASCNSAVLSRRLVQFSRTRAAKLLLDGK